MRRSGVIVLLTVALAGLVAVAIAGASDKRDLAFTIGVVPSIPAADLPRGAMVCQTPIAVPEEFDRVRLTAGSPGRPGPRLRITVYTLAGRELARGELEGGYPDRTQASAEVGRVESARKVSVCVTNAGRDRALIYGNTAYAALTSQAQIDGRALKTDLALVFLHEEPRSMLSNLGAVFDRASLFRPGWVGPWLFWLLSAGIAIGVPLLLARALAESQDAPAERP
jgi:hypothetical protein